MASSPSAVALQAAQDGNLRLLRKMAKKLDLRRVKDKNGLNALHFAASHGHPDCCKFLVEESGLDVNSVGHKGETPVFYATIDENIQVLGYLLDHGGDPTKPEERGSTPLHNAAEHGDMSSGSYFTDLLGIDVEETQDLSPSTHTPSDNGPAASKGSQGRTKNFKDEEDKLLVSAWLNVGMDPIQGVDQPHTSFWARIHDYFNAHKDFTSDRTKVSLMNRWSTIQHDVNLFCHCLTRIQDRNQSGCSIDDKIASACALFKAEDSKNRKFALMHCWRILKDKPKWIERRMQTGGTTTASNKKQKTKVNSSPSSLVPVVSPATGGGVAAADDASKRPDGRKTEKKKLRQRSTIEALDYLVAKMKEADAQKDFKKEERCNKAFALQEEKIKLEREKFEFQRDLEEERILGLDMSNMSYRLQQYYERRQDEIFARRCGHDEAVRLLLSKGVHVDPLNYRGAPLHLVASKDRDRAMKVLLEHGADPNRVVNHIFSPLMMACCGHSLKCVKLLVEAGADANGNSTTGPTPLTEAVDDGLTDIAKFLVGAGADPNIPDEEGRIPIMVAAARGKRELVEILFPRTKPIPCLPDWSVDGIIITMRTTRIEPQDAVPVEEQVSDAKSKGKEAFAKGDYLTAIYFYTLAMDKSPLDATLFANRSLCWLRQREGDRALLDAQQCRMLRPDWSKAWYREGAALSFMQDYKGAVDAFEEALKLDPRSDEVKNALREAIECLKRALP